MNIAFYSIVPLNHFKEATTLTILGIAKELKKQGHTVVIITEKTKETKKYQEIDGIPIYRMYSKGKILSHPLTLKKIKNKTNIKFDIIHCFSSTPLFVITGLLSKIIEPKAKIIHSLKSYSRSKITPLIYPLLNLISFITVPTKTFANSLKSVKKEKIKIINSPINLKKFYPKNKEDLKEKSKRIKNLLLL